MAGDDDAVIDVRGLHTRFGDHLVHRDLNLQMRRGEVLAVIGGSGSGKSVLMRQIVGLLQPQAGTVRVMGQDIHRLNGPEVRRIRQRWGVLFQHGALFSALDVFDNVAFPIRELRRVGQGMDEDLLRELVHLKLSMVGLAPEDAWKRPAELSGGMIKRAALARALALEAELLFLDEPTTGLDPVSATDFDHLLISLHRRLGLSLLLVTHDLHTLAALADRVAVLAEHRVLEIGTLQQIAEVDHPFIREFFRPRPGSRALKRLPAMEV